MVKKEASIEKYLFIGFIIVLLAVILVDTRYTGYPIMDDPMAVPGGYYHGQPPSAQMPSNDWAPYSYGLPQMPDMTPPYSTPMPPGGMPSGPQLPQMTSEMCNSIQDPLAIQTCWDCINNPAACAPSFSEPELSPVDKHCNANRPPYKCWVTEGENKQECSPASVYTTPDKNPDKFCSSYCTWRKCGDCISEGPDKCDPPGFILPYSEVGNRAEWTQNYGVLTYCKTDCKWARCGDGEVHEGEECDDGNLIDGDGCNSNCKECDGNSVKCGDVCCNLETSYCTKESGESNSITGLVFGGEEIKPKCVTKRKCEVGDGPEFICQRNEGWKTAWLESIYDPSRVGDIKYRLDGVDKHVADIIEAGSQTGIIVVPCICSAPTTKCEVLVPSSDTHTVGAVEATYATGHRKIFEDNCWRQGERNQFKYGCAHEGGPQLFPSATVDSVSCPAHEMCITDKCTPYTCVDTDEFNRPERVGRILFISPLSPNGIEKAKDTCRRKPNYIPGSGTPPFTLEQFDCLSGSYYDYYQSVGTIDCNACENGICSPPVSIP